MPTYEFRNKETRKEFKKFMTISEREEFLENNQNIEQIVGTCLNIGDPHLLGIIKPDGKFRDRLKDIKAAHPLGTIQTY